MERLVVVAVVLGAISVAWHIVWTVVSCCMYRRMRPRYISAKTSEETLQGVVDRHAAPPAREHFRLNDLDQLERGIANEATSDDDESHRLFSTVSNGFKPVSPPVNFVEYANEEDDDKFVDDLTPRLVYNRSRQAALLRAQATRPPLARNAVPRDDDENYMVEGTSRTWTMSEQQRDAEPASPLLSRIEPTSVNERVRQHIESRLKAVVESAASDMSPVSKIKLKKSSSFNSSLVVCPSGSSGSMKKSSSSSSYQTTSSAELKDRHSIKLSSSSSSSSNNGLESARLLPNLLRLVKKRGPHQQQQQQLTTAKLSMKRSQSWDMRSMSTSSSQPNLVGHTTHAKNSAELKGSFKASVRLVGQSMLHNSPSYTEDLRRRTASVHTRSEGAIRASNSDSNSAKEQLTGRSQARRRDEPFILLVDETGRDEDEVFLDSERTPERRSQSQEGYMADLIAQNSILANLTLLASPGRPNEPSSASSSAAARVRLFGESTGLLQRLTSSSSSSSSFADRH